MDEWRCSSISSIFQHWMEVIGQIHASATLPPEKSSPIPAPPPVGDCVESRGLVAVCVYARACVCVYIHIYRPVCVYNSNQHAASVSIRSATDIWRLAATDQTRFCAVIWVLLYIWLTIWWVPNPSVYGCLILSIVSGQCGISSQSVAQSSLASLSSAFNLKRSTRSVWLAHFTALIIYGEQKCARKLLCAALNNDTLFAAVISDNVGGL
jgi:hypothetical protein